MLNSAERYVLVLVMVGAAMTLPAIPLNLFQVRVGWMVPLTLVQVLVWTLFAVTCPISLAAFICELAKRQWRLAGIYLIGAAIPWLTLGAMMLTNRRGWEAGAAF